MIYIPRYRGRFGNAIFQYCFARILSINTGQGYKVPDIDDKYKSVELPDHKIVEGLVYVDDNNSTEVYDSPRDDINYQVWGFFQKYDYYRFYKYEILEWLPLVEKVSLHPEDIVIHVRRGDFFENGSNVLSLQYYKDALRQFGGYRSLVIIGNGIDSRSRKFFSEYRKVIYTNWPSWKDFATIRSANRIICSNSTFSWWGSWLSNARKIIQPVPISGYFSINHEHQRLYVDEPRYSYIENVEIED